MKDLGKLAAKFGVSGWRAMRKDELVRAVLRASKTKVRAAALKSGSAKKSRATAKRAAASRHATQKSSPKSRTATRVASRKIAANKKSTTRKTPPVKTARVIARIQKANADRERLKNLATPPVVSAGNGSNGSVKHHSQRSSKPLKDRIVLLVRDAYWLQAVWELTRQSVERAQAAMAEQWHTARPTLRLIQAEGGATTSTAERVAREIDIHGGVSTWYIDVLGTARSYRVDIGYLAANGRFYSLARSNTVTTPRPNNGTLARENFADIAEDCEKIYALSGGYTDEGSSEVQQLFEERLGRPMGSPSGSRFGAGADKVLSRSRDFLFNVDAEMIVFGATKPNAHVTLAGTPVKLRADGTFTARLAMPDRRQVLPIVASSADGVEQRTVVLAIERNTKVMEPMIREAHE